MRTLLRVREVEARYGRFVALANVSLVVPDRTVVALLGPNGVGKTTLLRTVSGMVRPTRGSVTFEGRRIDTRAPHAIARMGITHIPEGRGIFPGLSVRENLLMASYGGPGNGRRGLERVYGLFPVLGERREQVAGTLSGGEQQMLSLARAVVTRPRLLMIDELSLGLAPRVIGQLYETVEKIRDEGTAILLVEQYVRHALRLADIAVILHKGRVRFIGEPGELRREGALVEAYLGQVGTASYGLASESATRTTPARARVGRGDAAGTPASRRPRARRRRR